MIRLTALWLFVTAVAIYSFKNWYRAVLALVLLMAVVEHPDFPKSLFGIQGFNPWNLLLAIVVCAWLIGRRRENLNFDLPNHLLFLLSVFFFIIFVSFLRAATDLGGVIEFELFIGADDLPTFKGLFSDHIINCVKWVIPAFMLYDGCRDNERLQETVLTIIGVYFLLAVQVIRWMPLSAIGSGDDLSERALKILSNEVGYHRVNMSMMLSGAAWAAMFAAGMFKNHAIRWGLYFAFAAITMGMALTGGRTGYATWVVLGAGYAWLRSKKLFFVLPFIALIGLAVIPGVRERMFEGFGDNVDTNTLITGEENVVEEAGVDIYTLTSGRTFAWPFVVEKIAEKPWFGYGRMAMQRTGVSLYLMREYGESFPHPHNMYLQWVFDNGLIGLIPVLWFFALIGVYSLTLVRSKTMPVECRAVGGVTIALVGALFIAGVGSQTFYPREGAVCIWIAILLTVRVSLLHNENMRKRRPKQKSKFARPLGGVTT